MLALEARGAADAALSSQTIRSRSALSYDRQDTRFVPTAVVVFTTCTGPGIQVLEVLAGWTKDKHVLPLISTVRCSGTKSTSLSKDVYVASSIAL